MSSATGNHRPFDEVWSELERRHARKIGIAEWDKPAPAVSRMVFVWSDYDNRDAVAFRERHRLSQLVEDRELRRPAGTVLPSEAGDCRGADRGAPVAVAGGALSARLSEKGRLR